MSICISKHAPTGESAPPVHALTQQYTYFTFALVETKCHAAPARAALSDNLHTARRGELARGLIETTMYDLNVILVWPKN